MLKLIKQDNNKANTYHRHSYFSKILIMSRTSSETYDNIMIYSFSSWKNLRFNNNNNSSSSYL